MKKFLKGLFSVIMTIMAVVTIVVAILVTDLVEIHKTVRVPVATMFGVTIEKEIDVNINNIVKDVFEDTINWCNETAASF